LNGRRPPDLKTVGDALRHRRALIAVVILACVLSAGALSVVRHKTYEASALLYVDERHNSSQGFDLALQAGELLSHHYIEMATSRQVLDAACVAPDVAALAASSNSPCTPEALAGQVRADTVKGTSLIAVTADERTPEAAATIANAVATALVAQDAQQVDQLLKPTRDFLDAELKRLDGEIQSARQAVAASPPNSPQAQANLAYLNQLEGEYAADYARRQDLAVEQFRLTGNLSIIQAAIVPAKPVDPDPLRYLAAGLAVGLVVAFLAALAVEYLDDRLLEPDQLARAVGTHLVVRVPRANNQPRPAAPFALAHANLLALRRPLQRILVTGATEKDPADAIAWELAAAATEAGQTVAVVPTTALDGSPLPAADLTVIAAPSPESSSRVVRLAAAGGPAIVVATEGVTRFGDAQRTADLVRQAGAEVVAAVLVPPTAAQRSNGHRARGRLLRPGRNGH
jgi:capsular polysaccharide biosynthesis protein